MGVQFLLNKADDLLSTAVRKMTYNPLKFGDNTPVHVTEVELASIVDVQSVIVDDISVISEEQNNTVHVENIELSEDKGVLSMSVEDVVYSFKEEVIIGEELTSITSFEDKLKVMETSDISLPGSEDISTLKVDEYTQEDTEDVSSVDSKEYIQEDADDVYTSVVEEYIQEDIEDVSSRIAEEYIQDGAEDISTEMVDEHIQEDIQDTYTMVAEDIVLDKKEDISLISVDEVVFDKKEDVSLVGIELVKRIMDTRILMSVEEVKPTKDPQEYILEVQEPTYTFLNLGGEETTMKVEDVPSIVDSNNIMNIEPTDITTPAAKDTLILGKAKKSAGILEDTLKKIDKGNIDFYAIINTIIDFDTKQVMQDG